MTNIYQSYRSDNFRVGKQSYLLCCDIADSCRDNENNSLDDEIKQYSAACSTSGAFWWLAENLHHSFPLTMCDIGEGDMGKECLVILGDFDNNN